MIKSCGLMPCALLMCVLSLDPSESRIGCLAWGSFALKDLREALGDGLVVVNRKSKFYFISTKLTFLSCSTTVNSEL